MRAHPDEEQLEFLHRPSFLYFGIQVALLLLGLGLWTAREFDLLAASEADLAWDAAIRAPIDRTTPLSFDSTEIVMRRSWCEGRCPSYEVRMRSDGLVRFEGKGLVCAVGERSGSADPYAVRHLIRAMEAAGPGQIPTSKSVVIDAQTTTLLLSSENRVKGAVYTDQDDDALIEMGEHVDELADTFQWLPIRSGRYGYCLNDDGTFRRVY